MEGQYQAEEESVVEKYSVVVFFALVFLIGFLFVVLAFSTGIFLLVLGFGVSPSLSGLFTAGIVGGKEGIRDLLGQFKNWRCNPIWYLFAILFPLATISIGNGLAVFFGVPFTLPGAEVWISLLPVFLLMTIQSGLGEEIELPCLHSQTPLGRF